jgi:hypothetical protein
VSETRADSVTLRPSRIDCHSKSCCSYWRMISIILRTTAMRMSGFEPRRTSTFCIRRRLAAWYQPKNVNSASS